ncbi:1647_t:CDS:2, partial [Racocetra persica]
VVAKKREKDKEEMKKNLDDLLAKAKQGINMRHTPKNKPQSRAIIIKVIVPPVNNIAETGETAQPISFIVPLKLLISSPAELPRLPDINPQQTTQDIVNTTSNIGQQAAETSQQAGTEVKNTTDNMTNQIEDIIKQINNLKTELEGKINAVKNCVENEVSKINFQEIKDKIDTLGGLPGKLTELQDKYKKYLDEQGIDEVYLYEYLRFQQLHELLATLPNSQQKQTAEAFDLAQQVVTEREIHTDAMKAMDQLEEENRNLKRQLEVQIQIQQPKFNTNIHSVKITNLQILQRVSNSEFNTDPYFYMLFNNDKPDGSNNKVFFAFGNKVKQNWEILSENHENIKEIQIEYEPHDRGNRVVNILNWT